MHTDVAKVRAWFGDEVDEADGLAALALYERHVGIAPGPSPAATGRRLMDLLRPRGQHRDRVEDWPPCALTPNTVTDLSFVRDLEGQEPTFGWLHAYDKNGAYLAACSSVELGLGELEHVEWRSPFAPFNARLPGYWRPAGSSHWLPTPMAARFAEEQDAPAFAEAYVWGRHGRALTHWYERLRDARYALQGHDERPYRLALGAVKESYTIAIGWLCGYWFNPDDPRYRPESGGHASAHYRPDWRHMIIATARANMLRTLSRMDPRPVACHIDAVYIVSDCPSAYNALPHALTLGPGLGQWKIRYEAIPLDAVRPHLHAGGRAIALDRACQDWEDSHGDQ